MRGIRDETAAEVFPAAVVYSVPRFLLPETRQAASAFATLAEAAAFAETKSFFEAIPGTVSAAEGLKKTESKALVSKMLSLPRFDDGSQQRSGARQGTL